MLETFTETLPGGLFLRHWKIEKPKAMVLAVHGMGTHSGRFEGIAAELAEEGVCSFCYDHPGHGNSPGKRGHFESYDELLDALADVEKHCRAKYPDLPLFLYGHSMGGNVVANYILRRKPLISGAIISSPWLKLAFDPPFFKLILAKMVVNLFPGLRQRSSLNVNFISHDPEIRAKYDNDPMVHSFITPKFFLETSKAGLYALEHAREFTTPLYLYHGTEDHVTLFSASKKFAANAPNCTFTEWEGCYHEVHNEWVKKDLMKDIFGFIDKRIKPDSVQ